VHICQRFGKTCCLHFRRCPKIHKAHTDGVTFQKSGNIISGTVRIFLSILLGCGSMKAKGHFYNSKDAGRQKLELLIELAVHLSWQQMT